MPESLSFPVPQKCLFADSLKLQKDFLGRLVIRNEKKKKIKQTKQQNMDEFTIDNFVVFHLRTVIH